MRCLGRLRLQDRQRSRASRCLVLRRASPCRTGAPGPGAARRIAHPPGNAAFAFAAAAGPYSLASGSLPEPRVVVGDTPPRRGAAGTGALGVTHSSPGSPPDGHDPGSGHRQRHRVSRTGAPGAAVARRPLDPPPEGGGHGKAAWPRRHGDKSEARQRLPSKGGSSPCSQSSASPPGCSARLRSRPPAAFDASRRRTSRASAGRDEEKPASFPSPGRHRASPAQTRRTNKEKMPSSSCNQAVLLKLTSVFIAVFC